MLSGYRILTVLLSAKKYLKLTGMQKQRKKAALSTSCWKEIYEQPKAMRDTMTGRVAKDGSHIEFPELNWTSEEFADINKILLLPAVLLIMQVWSASTILSSWHACR